MNNARGRTMSWSPSASQSVFLHAPTLNSYKDGKLPQAVTSPAHVGLEAH